MEKISNCRTEYWSKNTKQQRYFISMELKRSIVEGVINFVVEGRRVCEKAWLKLFGIADRRYREIKKGVTSRATINIAQDYQRSNIPSRRHLQASTWLSKYIKLFGESQPDKEEFHLPKCLSKESIYGLYKDEMESAREDVLSLSAFREMWLRKFNHVKISTGKSGQPTCAPCTNFKPLLLKRLSKDSRASILTQLDAHLNLQARMEDVCPLYCIYKQTIQQRTTKIVMMFLAWLIKKKIFKKVKISFLMVGHTHEDIDPVFSRVSSGMAKSDAPTLPQLHQAIRKCTMPEPAVYHLKSLYGYKKKLSNARGLIEGVMGPHIFKFVERDGSIFMDYKDWPKDEEDYRSLNVTHCISSLDNPAHIECNSKINDAIIKMEQDLPMWAEYGRLQNEEVSWWKMYLSSCKKETRLRPEVEEASRLGRYRLPEVQEQADLGNLLIAVTKNTTKENRQSVLKLKKRPL